MRQPKPQNNPMFHANQHSWGPEAFTNPMFGYIEALLFASDRPLSVDDMHQILHSAGHDFMPQQIESAIRELEAMHKSPIRGLQLVEVAGGWQFRSNPEHTKLIRKLFTFRPPRVSQAALECLSAIAYRQPVTRAEVDAIRGVDSGGVMRTLIERKLIRVVGRHNSPGRPYLYATSPEFLEFFGLQHLRELPSLSDAMPSKQSSPVLKQSTEKQAP